MSHTPSHGPSRGHGSQGSSKITIDFNKDTTYDIVNLILVKQRRNIRIKSSSSYRKIHDMFATVIDDAIRVPAANRSQFLDTQLAKLKILVEYQKSRGQLTPNVADILEQSIDAIKNNNGDRAILEKVRALIDSIAVIATET